MDSTKEIKSKLNQVDASVKKFNARMDNLLNTLNKQADSQVGDFKMSYSLKIDDLFQPDPNESNRISKKYTRIKLKILKNIELITARLGMTGNVSLFNMFGENSKRYDKKYADIRAVVMQRLEVGVSRLKFETGSAKIPLTTVLFNTGKTKLYALRYDLIRQYLLTKMWKGVKNMSFYATKDVDGKTIPVSSKQEVPIDSFILPTSNTKLYALHMEALKHFLLTKMWKGVKNLDFYASMDVDGKKIPLTTTVDVPIESFIIPTKNSWLYKVQYELLKFKFLKKVKKGMNSLEFKSGKIDLVQDLLEDKISASQLVKYVGKGLQKNISKKDKPSEFAKYKQQKFAAAEANLSKIRNNLLRKIAERPGKSGSSNSGAVDLKQNKKTGTWEVPAVAGLGGIASKAAPLLAKTAAVGAAGFAGYKAGQWIDKKTGASTKIAAGVGKVQDFFGDKKRKKALDEKLNKTGPNYQEVRKYFNEMGGFSTDDIGEREKIYSAAMKKVRLRKVAAKKKIADMKAHPRATTVEDLNSIPGINLPGSAPATSDPLLQLIKATQQNKPQPGKTVIVNPRNNADSIFGGTSLNFNGINLSY